MPCKTRDYGKDIKVRIYPAKVNVNKIRYCRCPGIEPGKISIDSFRHLRQCPIRKRITSGKYTVDTTISAKIMDGNSLGVAING
jgi:hypothetical protein